MPWGVVVGTVVGAVVNADASRRAANTQADAARDANRVQWDIYQQQRQDQAPWLNAGRDSLADLQAGLGVGTGAPGDLNRAFTENDFHQDPGYQFRMQQGVDAIQGSALGGALNGNTLRALTEYGQNFASNEYQNAYARFNNDQATRRNSLSALAGIGQTAVNQIGQAGQNYAGNFGNNLMSGANARAAGQVGQANAWANAAGQIGNAYFTNQAMNNGGGGSGGWGWGNGWQMGGPNGTNDRGAISTGSNYDWWLRNGSGGD